MAPEYADYDTPKELADRIKELRDYINLLSEHHEMDMEILRLYLQPWNVEVDDGNLDSNAELIEIAKSTSQENAIITAMPPTLHNDCIPANWPLKISPNQDVKGQLEDDIVLGTAGKNDYYPAK
jgi:hypothetical protein